MTLGLKSHGTFGSSVVLHLRHIVISTFLLQNFNQKILTPKDIKFISFNSSAENFVDQVLTCNHVISSSLHGLIIAHAYLVPTMAIKISENVEGGDFKFSDHYRSLGIYLRNYRKDFPEQFLDDSLEYFYELVKTVPQPKKEKIEELQRKLLATFPLKKVQNPMQSVMKFSMFK